MDSFNIINYLSGLTAFVFDKQILNNIALSRGLSECTSFEELTQQQKDLCFADELFIAYTSPNVIASSTNQHGTFTHTTGAQTINNKKDIYNIMCLIYQKYGESDKLYALSGFDGDVNWVNENHGVKCM